MIARQGFALFAKHGGPARAFEAFTSAIQILRKIDPATMAAELVRLVSNPSAIASP